MKFYIIPVNEAITVDDPTINSASDAMEYFAWHMEQDMNTYFKAVSEDEYLQYIEDKKWEARKQCQIDFYESELADHFDEIPETAIHDVAENAYEIYTKAGSPGYWEVATEYDALELAVDEYVERMEEHNGK